jgi:hypothetical protein
MSINITDKWFEDPRRSLLLEQVGMIGDAVAMRLWRLAFVYYKDGAGLVPTHLFDIVPHSAQFIAVGLAERRDDGVYVKGSQDEFAWFAAGKAQKSEAGKKSAEARKARSGTAIPSNASNLPQNDDSSDENRTESEQEPNETERPPNTPPNENRTEPNETEPLSLSSSLSLSSEVSNETSSSSGKTKKKSDAYRPRDFESLLADIPAEQRELWNRLYPDAEFQNRTGLRAWGYYHRPKQKIPEDLGAWIAALDHWFDDAWPKTQVGGPSKGAGPERWLDLAARLFAAIKKFGQGDPEIESFIGDDWEWISRARLMSTVRAMQDTERNRERLAIDLKTAHSTLGAQPGQAVSA